MNNSYVHVNMTGELNILIFTTTFLVFQLTHSQPSTSNLTLAILQEHCRTGNGSQIGLNNLNNSGSQTELLIRPMWLSVDGNYTPWIKYIGCFEIQSIIKDHIQHQETIFQNNTVEGCYKMCQKKNTSCKETESVYFALKKSLCFCICKIQEFLAHSTQCNESCSSDSACRSENGINVYTEYFPDYERSDKFCMVCSKADTHLEAKLSFGCDKEPFGLCVERGELCFKEDDGNSNSSKINCTQQFPYVCLKNNDNKTEVTLTTAVLLSKLNSTSVIPLSEKTFTTTGISSELSSNNSYEISSFIPPHKSFTPFDKATTSNSDIVGVIVSLFAAVFALTSVVLLLWYYKTKRKGKLPDSQIDLHQLQSSQSVNNTYTDMMLVSGTERNENHVPLTTTNNVRNDDIYVENEDGEYDHLHSSRPKQVVSEREDERYATCTQLEDVSYFTVRKSRKSVPERDNENDNIAASFDSNFTSVANPDYGFCYLSSEIKDC